MTLRTLSDSCLPSAKTHSSRIRPAAIKISRAKVGRISKAVSSSAQQLRQAEPQTIEKGQTPDQVQGSLGKPDKIVNLGTKQIWVYKDLKVTFVNGKVSDVQ